MKIGVDFVSYYVFSVILKEKVRKKCFITRLWSLGLKRGSVFLENKGNHILNQNQFLAKNVLLCLKEDNIQCISPIADYRLVKLYD